MATAWDIIGELFDIITGEMPTLRGGRGGPRFFSTAALEPAPGRLGRGGGSAAVRGTPPGPLVTVPHPGGAQHRAHPMAPPYIQRGSGAVARGASSPQPPHTQRHRPQEGLSPRCPPGEPFPHRGNVTLRLRGLMLQGSPLLLRLCSAPKPNWVGLESPPSPLSPPSILLGARGGRRSSSCGFGAGEQEPEVEPSPAQAGGGAAGRFHPTRGSLLRSRSTAFISGARKTKCK